MSIGERLPINKITVGGACGESSDRYIFACVAKWIKMYASHRMRRMHSIER